MADLVIVEIQVYQRPSKMAERFYVEDVVLAEAYFLAVTVAIRTVAGAVGRGWG